MFHSKVLAMIFIFFISGSACLFAESVSLRSVIVAEIEGLVEVRFHDSGDWQEAVLDMELHENDEVRIGEDGFALLWVDEGAKTGNVEVEAGSLLRISTLKLDEKTGDKTTYIDLALGKVLVRAETLIGESKLEVRTPSASAGVRGTIFEVSVEEKQTV